MDKISISGGEKLSGSVKISGAKNSALPILFSTLLVPGEHVLKNIPDLVDVNYTLKILKAMGADFEFNKEQSTVKIHVPEVLNTSVDYDLVRKMRASILVMGPLLSRFGEVRVSLPGGCAIGTRPIDLHLKALEKMGAEIRIDGGDVYAKTNKLKGAEIFFEKVTVGGTENIMMAAALADGETILENAAREPEVVDLGMCLRAMGVKIEGLGTSRIRIVGAKIDSLKAVEHSVISDRIEAGTFFVAAVMTRSNITLKEVRPEDLTAFLNAMSEAGVVFEQTKNTITVFGEKSLNLKPIKIKTAPHPGFPTDLQAQAMVLLTQANGVSLIEESIFENRFMHVQELVRLGAEIKTNARMAQIYGPVNLSPAPVMATDLRASASLLIAGLAAQGETIINRVYHLDRGYERIEEKISGLGGKIKRI